MDDMDDFERRMAGEIIGLMGPVRPVDDVAIFNATTTASPSHTWRFQRLFSATKFVVAGVIVALFGSLVLLGVLAPQRAADRPPVAGASGDKGQPAIHWRSGVVDLQADSMTLRVGAEMFTAEGIDVVVDAWDGTLQTWALLPRWVEDGWNNWLYLEFASDGEHWRVRDAWLWRDWLVGPGEPDFSGVRVPAEFADLDYASGSTEFLDPAIRLPLGEPYVGDLTLQGVTLVPTCGSPTPQVVDVSVTFENLRLSVSPRSRPFLDELADGWFHRGSMLGDLLNGRLEPPSPRVLDCPP